LGLAPSERERVRSGASPFWRARNARQPYLVALGLPQRMRARAFAWALRSWTDMAAQRARAASRAAFLRSVGDRAALRAWPPRLPNQARYAATAGVRFMPRILPRPERQREKGRGGGSPMIHDPWSGPSVCCAGIVRGHEAKGGYTGRGASARPVHADYALVEPCRRLNGSSENCQSRGRGFKSRRARHHSKRETRG